MELPDGFQFSQGSLQDYADCRRRFQLRHILKLAWPAVQSEPVLDNELYMRQGETFHHILHQHLLGVPAERLTQLVHDEDLLRWWENYLRVPTPWGFQAQGLYPEITLTAALEGCRLVAKYDLIAVAPLSAPQSAHQRLVIVDWKTARKRPKRRWLLERLQTRVYPYLLAQAGMQFNAGQPVQPEQIEMIYWFADFPDQPEHIAYSAEKLEADGAYLAGLVGEIKRLGADQFDLTPQVERCAYCIYRSLCERGVKAGALEEQAPGEVEEAEAAEVFLDFEQVAEIEF